MGQFVINNDRFKEIYQEERNKLGELPCSDSDFIALDNAWKRWEEEKTNKCDYCVGTGYIANDRIRCPKCNGEFESLDEEV